MIWIGISDPGSLGSWCIGRTDESNLDRDPLVPLMCRGPGDLGSLSLIWIILKEYTLSTVTR